MCKWLEAPASTPSTSRPGSYFPHPRNPAGELPRRRAASRPTTAALERQHALRNYLLFRFEPTQQLFERRWEQARGDDRIEGINLPAAKAIKAAVGVPVLCTGGFQTAAVIREAIASSSAMR